MLFKFKNPTSILGTIAVMIVAIIGFAALFTSSMSLGDMRGMMGGETMKEMMQRMMGGQLPPGITAEALPEPRSKGAQLLNQYCSQCHELPSPGMHSAEEWADVVQRMNTRMRMMSGRGMMRMMRGIKAPTEKDLKTLIDYLQEYAQKSMDPTLYSDLDTAAGKAFSATCSRCHALPDPKQHTTKEWPVVVKRMVKNMKVMGKPSPGTVTLDTIVVYLQGHAKNESNMK